ncbi:MAG: hypothetical protein IJ572_02360 [Bacilli bacterium]|nr:hypothetical protein [Bacilli bacterium]
MTQKELNYIEDAISHEDNIIKILESTLDYLKDESLISYFKSEIKSHTTLKEKLISMMEDKQNG